MSDFFRPRVLSTARRISVLFIAFVLPLCFSIRLEDGFELAQSVTLLWILAFASLLCVGASGVRFPNRLPYACFGLFWLLGLYSFFRLRSETFFYLPTQNYLWLLGAVLLIVPAVRGIDKTKLYVFLVGSGVTGAFYSLAQALNLDLPGWSTNFAGRSFSTLGNPIFWAGYLLVVLPLALYLAGTTAPGWRRVLAVFTVLILAVSLVTTQTRGAWLGFGVEVVVLVFFLGRKNPAFKYLVAGLLFFGIVLMTNPSLRQRAISTLAVQSEDAKGRYFLWKVAEQQWKAHPWLGQGPGGYAAHFHRVQTQLAQSEPLRPFWSAFHAHNEYLEFLADRGLVGVLAGAFFVVGLFWARWKRVWSNRTLLTQDLAELAVFFGFSFYSFFHFPFSIVPVTAALALLMNPFWGNQGGTGRGSWAWAPLSLFLVVGCALSMDCLIRNAKLHRAVDLLGQKQPEEALNLLMFKDEQVGLHYWDPRVSLQRSEAFQGLGRIEDATRTLEDALKVYPDDADLDAALCMAYGQQKRWADAQAAGEKALQLAPSHPGALINMAVLFYLQGDKPKAIGYLLRLEKAEQAWGETDKASETRQKILSLS